jgi:heme A synthase
VNSAWLSAWILPIAISVLALADGVLHFMLDVVLFRGNFFGRFGPPPGAAANPNPPPGPPIPLPLPINQLFVLNLVGYLVLIALLWLAVRRFQTWRGWVDALFIVYVVVVFLGWVNMGGPNPQGLGYLSKGIELVLVITLLAYRWALSRSAAPPAMAQTTDQPVAAR